MKYNINSKENNNKVVLDRAEYEALLETFEALTVASENATRRLRAFENRPSDTERAETTPQVRQQARQQVSLAERVARAPTFSRPRSTRASSNRSYARSVTSIEGNGNTTQFGFSIKDTVYIINDVQIGNYLCPPEEKDGPVQYFTNRFVVVSIHYRRSSDGAQHYKLIKREPHNLRLIRRHEHGGNN